MYYASALTSELSAKQYGSSTTKGHLANPLDCQRKKERKKWRRRRRSCAHTVTCHFD